MSDYARRKPVKVATKGPISTPKELHASTVDNGERLCILCSSFLPLQLARSHVRDFEVTQKRILCLEKINSQLFFFCHQSSWVWNKPNSAQYMNQLEASPGWVARVYQKQKNTRKFPDKTLIQLVRNVCLGRRFVFQQGKFKHECKTTVKWL